MTMENPAASGADTGSGPLPAPSRPWHRRFGWGTPGFEATKRAFFLGLLTLVLLVPLGMIEDLVQERADRQGEVESEITSQWGGRQTVLGPILVVPYRYASELGDTATPRMATSRLFFLPKHLDIDAKARTERRSKSIYDVLVYGAAVRMTGSFSALASPRADIPADMIDWSGARLLIGVAEIAAIRSLKIAIAGQPPLAEDAIQRDSTLSSSFGAALPLTAADAAKPLDFTIDLDLRGSGALNFVPIADLTTVTLASDWPNPNFTGRTLPDTREISAAGFTARWSLGAIARDYPSVWRTGEFNLETLWSSCVGVAFAEPGDIHQQTDRILKYGVLVVALTFATIFINGLFGGRRVHPVQYLLVGAALCLFYLLLLSLSEQISFGGAYLVASIADIALIAWYAWRTMSRRLGYATAALLAALQTYMYVLLQMEDYALISGTVALFLALLAAMVATRNIDWYRIGQEPERRVA
jgi:inner membrane protein